MRAADHRPTIAHNWRCTQDPDAIERRVIHDLDTEQRVDVWRCRCGSWTPIEKEAT